MRNRKAEATITPVDNKVTRQQGTIYAFGRSRECADLTKTPQEKNTKAVDANIVLRYLINDHQELSVKVEKIIDNNAQ